MDRQNYTDRKITVMGLGLNGGGLACVRYFASRGAQVTATDLRTEEVLKPSLDRLKDLEVHYVLGEHRMIDFTEADIVIKNPAVPADSPYLKAAAQIETDLSVFLKACNNPLIAVTGSKGKSTVVSALHAIMKEACSQVWLGGNITVSPLSFIDKIEPDDPVILELSSWQLGDLRGRNLLHPKVSVITNIMNDHQNMYKNFSDYVDDKKQIYKGQSTPDHAIFLKDSYGEEFAREFPGTSHFYDFRKSEGVEIWQEDNRGIMEYNGVREELLPEILQIPGRYFRQNCLIAAASARFFGVEPPVIRNALREFSGVPHRMERVRSLRGVDYYNDTTATIPEALAAGVESFDCPVRLIAGGNDKKLEYDCTADAFSEASGIYLLKGTATDKMISLLEEKKISYKGPFASLSDALKAAAGDACEGDAVILSPGATSFGMFINEFDRGDQFRKLAKELK